MKQWFLVEFLINFPYYSRFEKSNCMKFELKPEISGLNGWHFMITYLNDRQRGKQISLMEMAFNCF